jgi:two-component system, cell cycle sensor histidine kinase and response regulator CckA
MSGKNSGALPQVRQTPEPSAGPRTPAQARPAPEAGPQAAPPAPAVGAAPEDPFGPLSGGRDRVWIGPALWAGLLLSVVLTLIAVTTDFRFRADASFVEKDADALRSALASRLAGNADYLRMLASERAAGTLDRAAFRARGTRYALDHPELLAFNWVDAASRIEDVAPLEGNEQVIGLHLVLPEPRRAADLARERRAPVYTRPFQAVQGATAFELWVPVLQGSELLGWLGEVYSCDRLLRHLTPGSISARNHVALVEPAGGALVELPDPQPFDDALGRSVALDPPGQLALRLAPHQPIRRPLGLALLGGLLAVLTCGMAYAMWALRRDARDRRRMEAASRRAGQVLRAVFDSAATAICAKDGEGRILLANRRFAQLYGIGPQPLVGRTLRELVPPALADRLAELDRRVLESGAPLEVEEALPVGGAIRVFLTAATPILDASGQTTGVCCGTTELTQRKALEEQLRRAQKMEVVGQVAGGVAHDFNNVLTAILGSATLLRDALATDPALAGEVEQIERACARAGGLTRQLLAFARRQVVEPVSVDLAERLGDLQAMLRRMVGAAIDLVILPAEGTWPTLIDPGQLEQVVANLVVNARDAMPDGGKLTLTTENQRLEEADLALGLPAGDFAVLVVKDTGTGVSALVREHLFEPFFSTKGKGKGTGLGLATCFGIVQQAGGAIEVTNEPAGGACFRVLLPRTRTPPSPRPGDRGAASLPRGTERVLLVEDEPMVRAATLRMLEALGYAVSVASNGEEALALAQRSATAFDLLLTDVVMPQMGGPELAARLRADRPALNVVYMSGYVDDALVCSELNERHAAFLQKPFTRAALATRVREALGSKGVPGK